MLPEILRREYGCEGTPVPALIFTCLCILMCLFLPVTVSQSCCIPSSDVCSVFLPPLQLCTLRACHHCSCTSCWVHSHGVSRTVSPSFHMCSPPLSAGVDRAGHVPVHALTSDGNRLLPASAVERATSFPSIRRATRQTGATCSLHARDTPLRSKRHRLLAERINGSDLCWDTSLRRLLSAPTTHNPTHSTHSTCPTHPIDLTAPPTPHTRSRTHPRTHPPTRPPTHPRTHTPTYIVHSGVLC